MKLYKYLIFIFILMLLVSSTVFAILRNNDRKILRTEINFKENRSTFLSVEIVDKILKQSFEKASKETKDILDLNFIENNLKKHPVVKNVEVFLDPSKVLKISIEERIPILRIVGKETFYIDEMGFKIPLSNRFTAHVPIFFGNFNEIQKRKLIQFIQKINADAFMKNEVIQIEKDGKKLLLNLRSYDFVVEWGDFHNYNQKVIKLKTLCKYLKMKKEEKRFKKVNLEYNQQVITSN